MSPRLVCLVLMSSTSPSESRRRASGRRDPLSRLISVVCGLPSPGVPRGHGTDESSASARGAWLVGLVPIRGLVRIVSLELVMALREAAPSVLSNRTSCRGGRGEVFAAGAKLRRVGPTTSAIGAYCIVEPDLV